MNQKYSNSFIAELFFGGIFILITLVVFVVQVQAHRESVVDIRDIIDQNPVEVCSGNQCRVGQFFDYEVFLGTADKDSLDLLDGTRLEPAKGAIAKAAYTYKVPVGFFTGIAYAESSVHENYYLESDKDRCHNPWGLKPTSGMRQDGSYLICFSGWDESTDYIGKLLREGYLDRGAKTVEGVAPYYKCGGWDGEDWCLATVGNWIRNVKTFAIF